MREVWISTESNGNQRVHNSAAVARHVESLRPGTTVHRAVILTPAEIATLEWLCGRCRDDAHALRSVGDTEEADRLAASGDVLDRVRGQDGSPEVDGEREDAARPRGAS